MKIDVRDMKREEINSLTDAGFDGDRIANERKTLVATDGDGNTAIAYVEESAIERLGVEYIREHAKLVFSKELDEWFLRISENDFHNDPARNPPRTIDVRFVEDMHGENTEIWRNVDTGAYYMRQLCREPFARWLTCDKRHSGWDDRACVRPNITFRHGSQTETTTFDDWNGTAAYSSTFNPYFRQG